MESIRKTCFPSPFNCKTREPEAIAHLEDILEVTDGVMIARGDLGVEMAPEKVPLIQNISLPDAMNWVCRDHSHTDVRVNDNKSSSYQGRSQRCVECSTRQNRFSNVERRNSYRSLPSLKQSK